MLLWLLVLSCLLVAMLGPGRVLGRSRVQLRGVLLVSLSVPAYPCSLTPVESQQLSNLSSGLSSTGTGGTSQVSSVAPIQHYRAGVSDCQLNQATASGQALLTYGTAAILGLCLVVLVGGVVLMHKVVAGV